MVVKNNKVLGLLDYGDMIYAPTVNDLAVSLSYALMNISDKVTIFVNITYSDFSDYKLEKILDTGIKQFYTKFPSMKKYFVSIKRRKFFIY